MLAGTYEYYWMDNRSFLRSRAVDGTHRKKNQTRANYPYYSHSSQPFLVTSSHCGVTYIGSFFPPIPPSYQQLHPFLIYVTVTDLPLIYIPAQNGDSAFRYTNQCNDLLRNTKHLQLVTAQPSALTHPNIAGMEDEKALLINDEVGCGGNTGIGTLSLNSCGLEQKPRNLAPTILNI